MATYQISRNFVYKEIVSYFPFHTRKLRYWDYLKFVPAPTARALKSWVRARSRCTYCLLPVKQVGGRRRERKRRRDEEKGSWEEARGDLLMKAARKAS